MSKSTECPIAIVILDGWGLSPPSPANALSLAHTPYYDEISHRYPTARLSVGEEQSKDTSWNATTGHMCLGAGRNIHTDASRITSAIRSGEFFNNAVLSSAMRTVREREKALHLVGLVSDAGIHSSTDTLFALLRMAKQHGLENVFVHCILDGRDVAPRSGDIYLEALEIKMVEIGIGKIASLCGCHFAMDTSGSQERTSRACSMIVNGEGEQASDASSAVRASYLRGISDEFVSPIVIDAGPGRIAEGDAVVFFNHLGDGIWPLVRAIASPGTGVPVEAAIELICLVEYDRELRLPVAFANDTVTDAIGSVMAGAGVRAYRFAESDRFPHVTKFLDGDDRLSDPHHDICVDRGMAAIEEPEMGSFLLTDRLLHAMKEFSGGVFVANYSAAGLAAQSGDLYRCVEAAQYIDTCLGGIYETVRAKEGLLIVTSTHSSCDNVRAPGSHAITRGEETSKCVPFHFVDAARPHHPLRPEGSLADIAPTVLGLLGINAPIAMSGVDLRL